MTIGKDVGFDRDDFAVWAFDWIATAIPLRDDISNNDAPAPIEHVGAGTVRGGELETPGSEVGESGGRHRGEDSAYPAVFEVGQSDSGKRATASPWEAGSWELSGSVLWQRTHT